MNPIKTIYIYIYYESSLTNYLSKSTTAPPSSTCQLSFLEFQFSLKKKKKFNEFHFYCTIDRISLSKRIHPFIFSVEKEISKGHASSIPWMEIPIA